jgi:hypothetical protein
MPRSAAAPERSASGTDAVADRSARFRSCVDVLPLSWAQALLAGPTRSTRVAIYGARRPRRSNKASCTIAASEAPAQLDTSLGPHLPEVGRSRLNTEESYGPQSTPIGGSSIATVNWPMKLGASSRDES